LSEYDGGGRFEGFHLVEVVQGGTGRGQAGGGFPGVAVFGRYGDAAAAYQRAEQSWIRLSLPPCR
jgi:hypothetical protein